MVEPFTYFMYLFPIDLHTHRNLYHICLSSHFSFYFNDTASVIFAHDFVLESGRLYVQLITTGFLTL